MELIEVRPGKFDFRITRINTRGKRLVARIVSEERMWLGLLAKNDGWIEVPNDMHLRPNDKVTIKIEIKKGA